MQKNNQIKLLQLFSLIPRRILPSKMFLPYVKNKPIYKRKPKNKNEFLKDFA